MQSSKNNVSIFKVVSYFVMSIALAIASVNITNVALARTMTKTNTSNQNISTTNTVKKIKDGYLTGILPRTTETQWSRGGGFISADNVNSSYFRITDYGELIIGPSTNGSDRIYAEGNGYFTGNLMVGQGSTIDGYNLKDYGQYWIDTPGTAGQVWTSDGYRAGHWATPSPSSSGSGSGVNGSGTGGFISRWQKDSGVTSITENSSIFDNGYTSHRLITNTDGEGITGFTDSDTVGWGVEKNSGFDIGTWSYGNKYGIIGNATVSNSVGIQGESNATGGIGVQGIGNKYGIKGTSNYNTGIYGQSNSHSGYGIYGYNNGGTGIYGKTDARDSFGVEGENTNEGFGVYGGSDGGVGVYGKGSVGTYGTSIEDSGTGVYGTASGNSGIGVYGVATGGNDSYAGYFSGNVKSTGKTQTSKLSVTTSNTPSSSYSSCSRGDITWDSNYIYVCVSLNNWKRSSLGSWTNSADGNIDNL